jgi:hypothetical protein
MLVQSRFPGNIVHQDSTTLCILLLKPEFH